MQIGQVLNDTPMTSTLALTLLDHATTGHPRRATKYHPNQSALIYQFIINIITFNHHENYFKENINQTGPIMLHYLKNSTIFSLSKASFTENFLFCYLFSKIRTPPYIKWHRHRLMIYRVSLDR